MKRLALFLLLLLLLPCPAPGEVILFEDENGKVIMNDDGEIGFVPPDGTHASPTPAQETPRPAQTPSSIPSTVSRR